jgi:pimeloyl-ACP methyl ester carboxylesterase
VQGADYVREKKWADEITPGIVVGDPIYLEQNDGHRFLGIYTEVRNPKAGLVIVHGMGVHPDWGLIAMLRSELAELGYTTLSVQMPVLANDAKPEDYVATFGEASGRLELAVGFLRAKGYKKTAIVSHSMGSRMTHHFLTGHPDAQINAWISIGMGGSDDYGEVRVPVLDLFGEHDAPAVLKNAGKRAASIEQRKGSQQIRAPKADHFFNNRHGDLVKYVKGFLDKSM